MGSVARITKPYRAAMKKDWESLKRYYEQHPEAVGFPLTVTKDTVLHIAVHSNDKKLLKHLLDIAPPFSYKVSDIYGNNAVHEAAATGNVEMAKILLNFDRELHCSTINDGQKNEYCSDELLQITNNRGETALFRAAAFGRTKMVRFLCSKIKNKDVHRRRRDSTSILHIAVLGRYFETASHLALWDAHLPGAVDENGMSCLQLLASMPSAFKSGYPMGMLRKLLYFCLPDIGGDDDKELGDSDDDKELDDSDDVKESGKLHSSQGQDLESGHGRILSHQSSNSASAISKIYHGVLRCMAKGFPGIRKLWGIKKKQKGVLELVQILAETDLTWWNVDHGRSGYKILSHGKVDEAETEEEYQFPSDPPEQIETTSPKETPLIAAARHGIVEIIKAILDVYPQAIEHINEKDESIFHAAARCHGKEILDLLPSSYALMPRLGRRITRNGDSILHQAAYLGGTHHRDRPGDALRMQSDIQWFKRVKKIVPAYFVNHRNEKGQTAQELFTTEHKRLVKDGSKWLMRTTQACTLVAVLIATVAFTSAYTVPGGSNSKTGHPLLIDTTPFHVFTISDTISLCFALTSVVVFLSIMTSNMNEQDFKTSLPLKLVLGLTTLFFAVTAMMVAFAATLVLMISQRLHWAAIPIYTVACCPVTIFLVLQFPLYLNIAWFTVRGMLSSFIDSLTCSQV
ncbi:PREDICTED: uncharacterized protein LOC105141473 [Populus euphratica]|uniref:Uncharacterized protein LOC105141473 n=1 Tax=Populus euphratica TaxID=75702 RepID=A0AAJ6Y9H3_POPEU|nr:PREDICTED: uncharacterized protein LOC105141473 [Populus euphratica]